MTIFLGLLPMFKAYGALILVSALLLLFYHWVMNGKQSFRFQRGYLLTIPMLCLIHIALLTLLPQIERDPITITMPQPQVTNDSITMAENYIPNSPTPNKALVGATSSEQSVILLCTETLVRIIAIAIPSVSIALLLMAIIPMLQLRRRLSKLESHRSDDGISIVRTNWVNTPFSVGRTIFMPEGRDQNSEEIFLLHERAHIKCHHYIDVWCIEVMVRLLWFNPILWMVRKMVRDLHEFEADYKVLSQGVDIHQYQCLLIQEAIENTIVISNGFNKSFIRQRLQQMKFKDGNTLNQVSQKLAVLLMIVLTGGITVLAMPERSIIVIPTGVDTDTIHTDRTQLPPTIQNNLAAVDSTIKSVQEDQNNLAVVEDSKASSDNVNEAKKLQQTKYIAATLNQENGTIDIHNVMEVPDSLAHIVERLSSKYIQYDTIPQFRLPHLKQAALNYDSLDYNTFAIYTNAHTVSPQEHADMLHRIAIWCTKKATYLAIVDKQNWPKRYFHTSPTEYLRDSKTGKIYPIQGMLGYPIGQTYWMEGNPSEWTCRVKIYPPLPKKCTTIDIMYGRGKQTHIPGTTGWSNPSNLYNVKVAALQMQQHIANFKPTEIVN